MNDDAKKSVPARRVRWASALPALFAGALLGFIAGYFAGGGGRPAGSPAAGKSAAGTPAGDRIAALQDELGRDPENPKLWAALGNAWYDREDWDHAVEAYRKALRKAPKDANVLSDLGAAYRNQGDFRQAIASFEKARAADSEHWQALLNLVLINAFDVRDAAAAQRHLDELKRRYPEIPNTDRIQEQISRLRAG
ncbi:MAG TPA: tetratricopeptide repeat protein [Thermoanaerobaculia bacterium]|nr:tetratricopeptide repeat protein [Thermoanaerobaculia bacterium]